MPIEVELPDGSIAEFPDGMDRDAITQALANHVKKSAKPTSWSDVPGQALTNLPSSAVKFAHDIVQPILHPIETVKGLYNVGQGLGSKAIGAFGFEQDPAEKAKTEAGVDAIGGMLKNRYGSLDAIKKTLATDPVGAAADASVVMTGGGAAASRLPGVVGRAGQVAARTGAAIDPLNATASTVRGAGQAATHVLGVTTGTGASPIRAAYEAGKSGSQAFPEHMRGMRPIDEVVEMAEKGVGQLVKDRGAAYKAGTAAMKADRAILDFTPVYASMNRAHDMIFYRGVAKDEAALKTFSDIGEKVQEFDRLGNAGRTAEGLDALKQAVGEIRQQTQQGTLARKVADQVYNDIKGEIGRQVPSYAEAMKGYAGASDQINEMRRTLSINDKATTDTTLRKLQSVMRNNVNTNYGARVKLADELGKSQPELMPALAGQAMNDWMPRGLARIGPGAAVVNAAANLNPVALAALPFSSPRLVGEAAYGLGRGAKVANDMSTVTGGNALLAALLMGYRGANAMRFVDPAVQQYLAEAGIPRSN